MTNEYKYETDDSAKLTLVPKTSQEKLNRRQLVDYKDHREKLVKWCLNFGKNPKRSEGYSPHTLENRLYRIDQFYRWVWENKDGYTTIPSPCGRIRKDRSGRTKMVTPLM